VQGPIAQIVALTIAGNAALKGKSVSGFWPGCSVFRHNQRVDFAIVEKTGDAPIERPYAADPVEWFGKLAERGILSLVLHHATERDDDRKFVGLVGGGGRWLMEARTDGPASDYWEGRWSFSEASQPGAGKWLTRYGRIAENWDRIANVAPAIEQMRSELERQLSEIAAFADREVDKHWGDWFRKGLAALRDPNPLHDNFHHDIDWTHSLPLAYVQSLAGVMKGWAFGGMGSWNDTGPRRKEMLNEYENRTERLYCLMIEIAVAVANFGVSDPPANPIGFRSRTLA